MLLLYESNKSVPKELMQTRDLWGRMTVNPTTPGGAGVQKPSTLVDVDTLNTVRRCIVYACRKTMTDSELIFKHVYSNLQRFSNC